MSDPAPETIIREAIALSSCDPDGACPSVCGSVPPIDNCLRHQAISAVRQLVRERDEARAENERLRLAISRSLSPLGVAYTHADILTRVAYETTQETKNVATIAATNANQARSDLFAALAAAQEPPASTSTDVKDGRCQKCGGFPLLDECGCLSGPWQEPPAKGGRRRRVLALQRRRNMRERLRPRLVRRHPPLPRLQRHGQGEGSGDLVSDVRMQQAPSTERNQP